jgi:DNA-binding NarL/FixJ family response regulator
MQAMTTLYAAWSASPVPPLPSTPRLLEQPGRPADLHVRALDASGHMILVSFSLGRLTALNRSELHVARLANAGFSNAGIARERQTSTHTVARQMSSLLGKLGVGSRLGLATIPELAAWSPSSHSGTGEGAELDALLSANGHEVEPQQVTRIWREIASGQWSSIAGVDAGGMRHTTMRRDSGQRVDWLALSRVQWEVLAFVAGGLPQKVIAMKRGLAPSTVSSALAAAGKRLGFASQAQLLRAYCAAIRSDVEIGVPHSSGTGTCP